MADHSRLRLVGIIGAVVTGLVLAASSAGGAICPDNAKCGGRQTLVRIDTKTCRSNRQRPAIIVRRACCENSNGKIRCLPFKKCPKRSPSGGCS